MSRSAEVTLALETDLKPADLRARADVVHAIGDMAAPISSGSFPTLGMIDRAVLDPQHEPRSPPA